MSTPSYILKRILVAIPLLFFVSLISFFIIRLNIRINHINLSVIAFLLIGSSLFYLLSKIKSWYILGLISLFFLLVFCLKISTYHLLPVDTFSRNTTIISLLNFVIITSLALIYWFDSLISKSKLLPLIIIGIFLAATTFVLSNHFPVKIQINEIILKTGDPLADLRFNPAISREILEREEKRLGLNEPLHIQYLLWLKGIFHSDFGITQQNQKVVNVIKNPIRNTLLLSLSTLLFTWLIAIPLGIWAALKQNKFIDKFFAILTSCGMSTPTFVLAVLALLFALNTQLLPIGGLTSINFYEMSLLEKVIDISKHLILPTVVLTLISIAGLQRQMRANLLEVLRQEYIKTAVAKGLPSTQIIYKHALRNAINPLITIFGFEFGSLLSGAALTETIVSYPGLGALTLEAARKMDVNLTMATLLLGAVMLITGNLIADILLKFADPRIRFEGKA